MFDDSLMKCLDVRQQLCPMPVIKTQNMISEMSTGEQLRVVCTDPGCLHDIPAWCRVHGHEVVDVVEGEGEYAFLIKIGGV